MYNLVLIGLLSVSHAITVLVVDAGVDTKDPVMDSWLRANIGEPTHEHGQNVASAILLGGMRLVSKTKTIEEWEPVSPVCDEVRLDSCNYLVMGVDYCANLYPKYDFVNISAQGNYNSPLEFRKIKEALAKGTLFTVAAGNDKTDVVKSRIYPAMYKYLDFMPGYFVVTSNGPMSNTAPGAVMYDHKAWVLNTSRKDRIVESRGTSISSALYLNSLIRERCKSVKRLAK